MVILCRLTFTTFGFNGWFFFLTFSLNSEGVASWVQFPNGPWFLSCYWKETCALILVPLSLGDKTRELEFSHLILSVYSIIAGFIVFKCCWKTQQLLSHYVYIFLSPTIYYNIMPLCSVSVTRSNQYLLGIHWMCDIVVGAAKGTYLEWSIIRKEGDNFSIQFTTLAFTVD